MNPPNNKQKERERTESQRALRLLSGAMLAGLASVLVYAIQVGGKANFFTFSSLSLLLAGASALAGGTMGFLFGIPRTLQQEGAPAPADPQAENKGGGRIDYRVNTNLEQISDWLTKILVGVGLTQITEIKEGVFWLTDFAAQGLGAQAYSQVFAFALLSYFAVLGFLFGYLWTRLFLAGALRQADQAAIGELAMEVQKATEKVETTERKLEAMKKQSELDAEALNLVYRQLNPSPDLPSVSQEDLNKAVSSASHPVKVQVFNQAWQIRSETWKSDKPKMELTIPLIKALIAADTENEYHRNHGQLGFALKDKTQPDWAEAEKELTKAIELRGPWKEGGWLFYEFNRALCGINLDPEFSHDLSSTPKHKQKVMEDLKAAAQAPEILRIIKSDPITKQWMQLNEVTDKDIK